MKDTAPKDDMSYDSDGTKWMVRRKRCDSGLDVIMKPRKRGWWMKRRIWPIDLNQMNVDKPCEK